MYYVNKMRAWLEFACDVFDPKYASRYTLFNNYS